MNTTASRFLKLPASSRSLYAALLLAWLLGGSASAQTFWIAEGAGNWNVPTNWSAGIPTALVNAQINNGGTVRLVDPGARANDFTLGNGSVNSGTLEVLGGEARFVAIEVGRQGTGALSIAGGGSVSNAFGFIGRQFNAIGTATVDGAGSAWTNSDRLIVGENGMGALSITRGGRVSNTTGLIGLDNGSSGIVTVDGPGSTWTNSSSLTVAYLRPGTLSITGGGWVTSIGAFLGQEVFIGAPANGAVTVDGANSAWLNTGAMDVGANGTGSLTIINGGRVSNSGGLTVGTHGTGTVSIASGGSLSNTTGYVGFDTGSTGTATVDGLGSAWTNSGELTVGYIRNGSLTITGGGRVSSTNGYIGREGLFDPSRGTVVVDGAGSAWTNSGELNVGFNGVGALSVTGGAAVSNTIGVIARGAGSSGVVTVDGTNSTWTNSSDFAVGSFGTATLSVMDGGRVSNFNGSIGASGGSIGTATVDGAGSMWTNSSVLAVGVFGRGTLNITGGGAVSSTNGRIGREAGSTGTVLIDGPGSRWDCSGALTMGLFGFGAGTLDVRNSGVLTAAGGMSMSINGALRGDGTIVANVENAGGFIAPGASAGALHITGNFTQSTGLAMLQIELASDASFDKLAVTGIMTLGGRLDVRLTNGYVPHGRQSFDVLDWGGFGVNGAFSAIFLPTLGGTLVWDTSQLYTTGVLSVVGPPAPAFAADFDDDGDVDGADLTQWQGDFGANALSDADDDGDSDGADFLAWQRQLGFGASAQSSGSVPVVAAAGAVPEPATAWLAVLAGVCFGRRLTALPKKV